MPLLSHSSPVPVLFPPQFPGVLGVRDAVRGLEDAVGIPRFRRHFFVQCGKVGGAAEGRGPRAPERFVHQPG